MRSCAEGAINVSMPKLNLKTTHKAVKDYYAAMKTLDAQGARHEGAVSPPFYALLEHCAKKMNAACQREYRMQGSRGNIFIDGAVLHELGLPFAYWEAKDIHDNLAKAVQQKREAGYPFDNILFQTPKQAILFQNEQETLNADISVPKNLVKTLELLFEYERPEFGNWDAAASEFREHVPAIAKTLKAKVQTQRDTDSGFAQAFDRFYETCRASINPDLSTEAVEEMLIQHILTERIFRTVFHNSNFTRRNIIAREIEDVVDILMREAISREVYLQQLDRYYNAVEQAAKSCQEFSQKQRLLNAFYETFFQSYSKDAADTHGIVYTPQPIVEFMVNSVQHLLKTEFNRSLSSEGVHIIDPFVGTGNFIVRLMREIKRTALERKYAHELHCAEVMLLPYYIASLNIEQEYFERTKAYRQYEKIVLADTFELMETPQGQLFTEENDKRAKEQRDADMFVVIGNPPYNAGQVNENDNNKNRKYEIMDGRVRDTYAADSKARNKNALYDPYVKAIRWASDRIKDEGVVAFVTNNGFLDGMAFDGMRKHLEEDFDAVYVLDLGGNARKGLKVADANVFGIRVGVSINLFIKTKQSPSKKARIFYHRADDMWNKEQKFAFMSERKHVGGVEWQEVHPDANHTWLTEGLHPEFHMFIPIGSKKAKALKGSASDVIFKIYSAGVKTNRDAWAINFNRNALDANVQRMIENYNIEVDRWKRRGDDDANASDFVTYDDTKISWSSGLRNKLERGVIAEFDEEKLRTLLYRPFTKSNIYFDRMLAERVYVFPSIFPTPETETENYVICVNQTQEKPFTCVLTGCLPDLVSTGGFGSPTQCFPFYTYDEDGSNRQENITDWALSAFRSHYGDSSISKWDIFHYVYGLLHHPDYRERYEKNLKRDLPHIPFAPEFRAFASAGRELADLHVNYESAEPYALKTEEADEAPLDFWRAEKMRFSKDKTAIAYNDYLTLSGIPPAALEYRLGNRSALEWVVNQYQVKTDKRSGIVNDPNRPDDPQYIVNLLRRVVSVSLKTVEIVNALPPLAPPS